MKQAEWGGHLDGALPNTTLSGLICNETRKLETHEPSPQPASKRSPAVSKRRGRVMHAIGIDLFPLVWGAVWTVLVAIIGRLWQTMASKEDISRVEQTAKAYADRVVEKAEIRHRDDLKDIGDRMERGFTELRRILLEHHRGDR